MRRIPRRIGPFAALALAAALAGCAETEGVIYKPRQQLLPSHINRIAIRPVTNKTQQFGLEDKLTLRIRDEFLRDGRYQIMPEGDSDGVVAVNITRYILTPTQYDTVLTPTAYKLWILVNLTFIDRTKNTILWTEPNLEGIQTYTASTLQGGITEEEARELIWDVLARDIVKRTVEGFGAASGRSSREIKGEPPPSEGAPPLPPKPILQNPY